jgi:hypothetical protein
MMNVLGMNVISVQSFADGSGVTTPTQEGSVLLVGEASARREIQIALAGASAEYRYCEMVGFPEEAGFHPIHGKHHDDERAWNAAKIGCGGDVARAAQMLKELRPRVEVISAHNIDAIITLATALQGADDGSLSGAALRELLAASSMPPESARD